MTVCNATVGNLSSLLPGRLELPRGRGRKGNAEGRGQDRTGTRWGYVGKREESDRVSEPGGSAEPGRASPRGGKGGAGVCLGSVLAGCSRSFTSLAGTEMLSAA